MYVECVLHRSKTMQEKSVPRLREAREGKTHDKYVDALESAPSERVGRPFQGEPACHSGTGGRTAPRSLNERREKKKAGIEKC